MTDLKEAIEATLSQFWEEVALEEAGLPQGVESFADTLDSPSAVDALLRLEKVVGIKLEASELIRRGGYDSKEQFMTHLTERVLQSVEKNNAG